MRCGIGQIREEGVGDEALEQAALANEMDALKLVFDKALDGLLIDRFNQDQAITARFLDENEFRAFMGRYLLKQAYD
jgi:type I restriction enzyme R subunit